MTAPFITSGVRTTPSQDGSVPIRREIRDLEKNYPLHWSLYLLGLRALQSVDEDDDASYYQIAGIHGRPFKAWNGVTGANGENTGYCTHSSILFLPWHRPYLALFEQVLHDKIQIIASQFPTSSRQQYVAAAQEFRIPFWDWGILRTSTQNAFPDSVGKPTVTVTGPKGPETFQNPLYQYDFNTERLKTSGDFPNRPFDALPNTVRYPRSGTLQSQDARVTSAINGQNRNIRSQIRYILGSITEFGPFSNDEWIPGDPGAYASLEDIHDNLHVLTGGSAPQGNMSIVPYAAFDPVFMLHHCNVDRLFAIWQALHPDSYVEPQINAAGTFTEAAQTTEDKNTPLTPFWRNANDFHTSEGVASTETFGYAYPETQAWTFNSTADYQRNIVGQINQLYASSGAQPSVPRQQVLASLPPVQGERELRVKNSKRDEIPLATPPAEKGNELDAPTIKSKGIVPTPTNDITAFVASVPGNTESGPSKKDEKYREWLTNIRVQKHSLGGSFLIHIFLGDVPASIDTWVTDENNVGSFAVLGSSTDTGCGKCITDAERGLIVSGVVPLTEALVEAVEKGQLRSLEVSDVEPFLKEKLHWRVTQPDGAERDREEVTDLKISVVSTEVTAAGGPNEFPIYSGVYDIHPACTEGRPGGFNDGEQA